MIDVIKKSDLRTGMRVTKREGDVFTVLLNVKHDGDKDIDAIVGKDGSWEPLSYYADDLTAVHTCDDIVKVEVPRHCYMIMKPKEQESDYLILWKREPIIKNEDAIFFKVEELELNQQEKILIADVASDLLLKTNKVPTNEEIQREIFALAVGTTVLPTKDGYQGLCFRPIVVKDGVVSNKRG
jgi:hypothetical protein